MASSQITSSRWAVNSCHLVDSPDVPGCGGPARGHHESHGEPTPKRAACTRSVRSMTTSARMRPSPLGRDDETCGSRGRSRVSLPARPITDPSPASACVTASRRWKTGRLPPARTGLRLYGDVLSEVGAPCARPGGQLAEDARRVVSTRAAIRHRRTDRYPRWCDALRALPNTRNALQGLRHAVLPGCHAEVVVGPSTRRTVRESRSLPVRS